MEQRGDDTKDPGKGVHVDLLLDHEPDARAGSGTDVSHYFVRFFAVVSEVFCLKKCCVFFVLLLCVLDSFCN